MTITAKIDDAIGDFKRLLPAPKATFFLLGPRGTGKSTWLLDQLPGAYRIDLLRSTEYLKFKRDPSELRAEVLGLPQGTWIILDEIQKLPELLDEVHALIFDTRESYLFALSGSSARKLKGQGANLLAGRALSKKLFTLTSLELGKKFDLRTALEVGQLPMIWRLKTRVEQLEFLDSYVETYLKEEIQQEALVRRLDSFFRFMQIAAISNAQVLSVSNIARDVGVSRSTVQGYFDILSDTLLGWTLPAFKPKAKVKELSHPKFYFFDCGVARTLLNETRNAPSGAALGHLFETFFINECRALNSYFSIGAEMAYWQTEHGTEVDLILSRGKRRVGLEIKYSTTWKRDYNKGLRLLLEAGSIERAMGVYTGTKRLMFDGIEVLPYWDVLKNFSTLFSA